ncbi:L,D-transpeptidase [Halomonas sp. TBZ9]|uniref:L,D-transpeptidase n=1 Tax=Vreelandella azerica TaxID=2732867 RepID=A0A7Y3XBG5_9GAMM|nr:L,D-transpeptidase [Halomonas azerica]
MMPVNRRQFLAYALCLPASVSMAYVPAGEEPDLIETLISRAHVPRFTDEVWVLIDDQEATLSVYRGNSRLEHYAPVSLGRSGAKTQRLRGSNVTPKGEFRINRFNYESQWHIFVGIDYPTPAHARMALKTGVYSQQDYDDYFDYYRRYGSPPQDTVLGGAIGVHGLGGADPEIHQQFHWTQGCVALTNAQIERFSQLIGIGTRVVIR